MSWPQLLDFVLKATQNHWRVLRRRVPDGLCFRTITVSTVWGMGGRAELGRLQTVRRGRGLAKDGS